MFNFLSDSHTCISPVPLLTRLPVCDIGVFVREGGGYGGWRVCPRTWVDAGYCPHLFSKLEEDIFPWLPFVLFHISSIAWTLEGTISAAMDFAPQTSENVLLQENVLIKKERIING